MRGKILIYGLGERFHNFYFKNVFCKEIENYYEIFAVSDRKVQMESGYLFINREEIHKIQFDAIVITSDRYYQEICEELSSVFHVEKEKLYSLESFLEFLYKTKFKEELFDNKYGLEIGGPTELFSGNVYQVCKRCDVVNYCSDTVWWSSTNDLYLYKDKVLGNVIINDVTHLSNIEDEKYDFCISSNNLEHVANPIKALLEMKRVIKQSGTILVVVPKKDISFDHNRKFTTFDHILKDFTNGIGEDDLSHLEEIIELHDYDRDPLCGGKDKFVIRSRDNYHNRCLHHHVFCKEVLIKMVLYADLQIIDIGELYDNYYMIVKK